MLLLEFLTTFSAKMAENKSFIAWASMKQELLTQLYQACPEYNAQTLEDIITNTPKDIGNMPLNTELRKWSHLFSDLPESKIIRLLYECSFEAFSIEKIRRILQIPESEPAGKLKRKLSRAIHPDRLSPFYPLFIVEKLTSLLQHINQYFDQKDIENTKQKEPGKAEATNVGLSVSEATKAKWRGELNFAEKLAQLPKRTTLTEWLKLTPLEKHNFEVVKKTKALRVELEIVKASKMLELKLTDDRLLVLSTSFEFNFEKKEVKAGREKEAAAVLLLCTAAAFGDLALCEILLEKYPKIINKRSDMNRNIKKHPALFLAARKNHFKIFLMLLEKGADYLWVDESRLTLLYSINSILGLKLFLSYLLINKSPSETVQAIQTVLESKTHNGRNYLSFLYSLANGSSFGPEQGNWLNDEMANILLGVLTPFVTKSMFEGAGIDSARANFITNYKHFSGGGCVYL